MRRSLLAWVCVAILLLFSGCDSDASLQTAPPEEAYPWVADHSPIPARRTGLDQQGVYSSQNSVECTDSGIYFLYPEHGATYLLYGDHGSDTLLKLCGRPDCAHSDESCNAWFNRAVNICYYEGYLYILEGTISYRLLRLKPDGTERQTVLNLSSFADSFFSPHIWNGILTMFKRSLNDDGTEVAQHYYYRLDGSMEGMEPTDLRFPWGNDGEHFISFFTGNFQNADSYAFYLWDPVSGKETYLTDFQGEGEGYYGAEQAYYMEDGAICRLTYASGDRTVLVDTGLEGTYNLHCFPDCLVVSSCPTTEQQMAGEFLEEFDLYFYNWDYEFLGQTTFSVQSGYVHSSVICGETPDRIILTDNSRLRPTHYIEKSDFGTGNIELHAYLLPDFAVEEVKE